MGKDVVIPGAIPVVRFTTEERLNEMIDTCREIGVGVANPHVNHVEGGGRYREDNVQLHRQVAARCQGTDESRQDGDLCTRQVTEGEAR